MWVIFHFSFVNCVYTATWLRTDINWPNSVDQPRNSCFTTTTTNFPPSLTYRWRALQRPQKRWRRACQTFWGSLPTPLHPHLTKPSTAMSSHWWPRLQAQQRCMTAPRWVSVDAAQSCWHLSAALVGAALSPLRNLLGKFGLFSRYSSISRSVELGRLP